VQITLLRHGMPDIDKNSRISATEFGAWVSKYDAASLDINCEPPQPAIEQANRCAFVVCSDLLRSLESAKALGLADIDASEAMFRELDTPHANWHFPRLSPGAWAVIFRIMWAAGYSTNVETFAEARERARHCAERLSKLASEHGKILFVGHGLLNWFISRYLKKMGWDGSQNAPRRYWEFAVYHYCAG
jgi:broad specificity phosphatase PhoE